MPACRSRFVDVTVLEAFTVVVSAAGLVVSFLAARETVPYARPAAVLLCVAGIESVLIVADRRGLLPESTSVVPLLDLGLLGALFVLAMRAAGRGPRGLGPGVAALVVAFAAGYLATRGTPAGGIVYFVGHQALYVGAATALALPRPGAIARPASFVVAGLLTGVAFTSTAGILDLLRTSLAGASFGPARSLDVATMPAIAFFGGVAAIRWGQAGRLPLIAFVGCAMAAVAATFLPRSNPAFPPLGEIVFQAARPSLVAWGIAGVALGGFRPRALRAAALVCAGAGLVAFGLAVFTRSDLGRTEVPALGVIAAFVVVLIPGILLLDRLRRPPEGASSAWTEGRQVAGRYRVVRALGAGGQGSAFEARDADGRSVVLKREREGHATGLAREARLASRVHSPFVARVHGLATEGETTFLVRDHVEGVSLAEAIAANGAFPRDRVYKLARDMLAGLHSIHAAGILHLDVKPANIILARDGRAVLIDLGIARTAAPAGAMTIATQTDVGAAGSLGWVAPEVLLGARPTEGSDVYCAALALRAALTGGSPYAADERFGFAVAEAIARGPPLPVLEGALGRALARALARDPTQRTRTASALARDLALAEEEERAAHAEDVARSQSA